MARHPLRRVVKVGTSLLRGTPNRPTTAVIADLAASLNRVHRQGEAIALVTSGAVGLGCTAMEMPRRPSAVEGLQAAAAVGQGHLMALYQDAFAVRGLKVAQVLVTRGDLASRRRYQNASRTLEQLLSWGVVPVVNENDTLATDELRFGDNDTLSALVAVAIGAATATATAIGAASGSAARSVGVPSSAVATVTLATAVAASRVSPSIFARTS